MSQEWYYTTGGQQAGPVSWDDLAALAAQRKLALAAAVESKIFAVDDLLQRLGGGERGAEQERQERETLGGRGRGAGLRMIPVHGDIV